MRTGSARTTGRRARTLNPRMTRDTPRTPFLPKFWGGRGRLKHKIIKHWFSHGLSGYMGGRRGTGRGRVGLFCGAVAKTSHFRMLAGNNRGRVQAKYSPSPKNNCVRFRVPRFRKPPRHRLSIYLIETPRPLETWAKIIKIFVSEYHNLTNGGNN